MFGITSVEGPLARLEEKVQNTKSSLPVTQYDAIEQATVEQRSRLVDLLVRVENRMAQLADIIKEKTEMKLNNCQIRVIDIETELEMGLESNVELDRLRKQNQYTKELKLNLDNVKSEFEQLRDVQLKAVKIGLPTSEQEELSCLTNEIETLIQSVSALCHVKLDKLGELLKRRIELWHRGKELDTWMTQAEGRRSERVRHFPVNPDKMAKIISQYKGFTRELLARQKPLETLAADSGSLQVCFLYF